MMFHLAAYSEVSVFLACRKINSFPNRGDRRKAACRINTLQVRSSMGLRNPVSE